MLYADDTCGGQEAVTWMLQFVDEVIQKLPQTPVNVTTITKDMTPDEIEDIVFNTQTDRQKERQPDRQTKRQTDKQ